VQYMQRVGHELPLLVLGVAFAAVALLPGLHLSGMLACMVAGFYIENFSPHGDDLMRAIERHALPVYVVFFTLAGAGLDVPALRATWPLAVFLVLLRLLLTTLGTVLGAALGRAPRPVLACAWSGFVAQAGINVGIAALVGQRFPQFGESVQTVLLAMVALNQIAGPVLFRLGLTRAGEVHSEDEAQTADAPAPAAH
ncbi:MAG: cation:proton antiporter, partial [Candidatus Lambdaproteobacteria bacterium]|nr:cation:proton antiporter [Candidatus Lambdaproteobacteria bacterium]